MGDARISIICKVRTYLFFVRGAELKSIISYFISQKWQHAKMLRINHFCFNIYIKGGWGVWGWEKKQLCSYFVNDWYSCINHNDNSTQYLACNNNWKLKFIITIHHSQHLSRISLGPKINIWGGYRYSMQLYDLGGSFTSKFKVLC